MKRLILFLLAAVLLPLVSNAGIPISQEKVAVQNVENFKKRKVRKLHEKKKKPPFWVMRLFKKIGHDKYIEDAASGSSLFNWLSFTLSLLALMATIAGVAILGIPLALGALVLGILGVKKNRPLKGLGIAGIALGGTLIFLWVLLVVLLAAILL